MDVGRRIRQMKKERDLYTSLFANPQLQLPFPKDGLLIEKGGVTRPAPQQEQHIQEQTDQNTDTDDNHRQ
jgi:hypothetical protein